MLFRSIKSEVQNSDLGQYAASLGELNTDHHDLYETETAITNNDLQRTARKGDTLQPLSRTLRVPTNLVALCDGVELCSKKVTDSGENITAAGGTTKDK